MDNPTASRKAKEEANLEKAQAALRELLSAPAGSYCHAERLLEGGAWKKVKRSVTPATYHRPVGRKYQRNRRSRMGR